LPAPEAVPATDAAPAPDAAADLALVAAAAEGAAEIALSHWRRDPKVWHKPGDEGPVTEADLEVDTYLKQRLRAARPDYGWMSEETPDAPAARDADTLFIVDPIDGTRAFARGEPVWAHSLAVVRNGRPVAAVVHLPALCVRYAAAAGQGATRDGEPITVGPAPALDRAQMLVTKHTLAPHLWRGGTPGLVRHFRPSLAYRIALVAEGRFDGMLTLRDSWEWDIAAGALIAEEAGARVTDRAGRPLLFNAPGRKTAGLVVAPPALHAETLARLAPDARID
jgi:myo-inositol-1(or 4)-monophosphatase